MEMMKWLARFGIVTILFLGVDMIWLVLVAQKFYSKHLGFLMRDPVNWPPALIFYALFVIGMLFFAIQPALQKDSLGYAVLAGALFGLMTYATYDLTNLATLKDWPVVITIVDLAWGTTVSTLVSTGGFLLIRKWLP